MNNSNVKFYRARAYIVRYCSVHNYELGNRLFFFLYFQVVIVIEKFYFCSFHFWNEDEVVSTKENQLSHIVSEDVWWEYIPTSFFFFFFVRSKGVVDSLFCVQCTLKTFTLPFRYDEHVECWQFEKSMAINQWKLIPKL